MGRPGKVPLASFHLIRVEFKSVSWMVFRGLGVRLSSHPHPIPTPSPPHPYTLEVLLHLQRTSLTKELPLGRPTDVTVSLQTVGRERTGHTEVLYDGTTDKSQWCPDIEKGFLTKFLITECKDQYISVCRTLSICSV